MMNESKMRMEERWMKIKKKSFSTVLCLCSVQGHHSLLYGYFFTANVASAVINT